jgi:O-acetyl-ADP-ribose deacetylase (regulator of RNase III)
MIKYLENKNLLTWFEEQKEPCAIAHQCNCFHTMGGGIARQISSRYPEALEADKDTPYGDKTKLGLFSVALVKGSKDKLIYNVYGQHRYGTEKRHTSYDALVEGLARVQQDAQSNGLTKLGIPYNMGCKLGGGEWQIVKSIVEVTFAGNICFDLYVCRYEP